MLSRAAGRALDYRNTFPPIKRLIMLRRSQEVFLNGPSATMYNLDCKYSTHSTKLRLSESCPQLNGGVVQILYIRESPLAVILFPEAPRHCFAQHMHRIEMEVAQGQNLHSSVILWGRQLSSRSLSNGQGICRIERWYNAIYSAVE